jgi:hypothetical protein
MFAASAECLLNNHAQSHMPTADFFKHKELKMSKTRFFSNGTNVETIQ